MQYLGIPMLLTVTDVLIDFRGAANVSYGSSES